MIQFAQESSQNIFSIFTKKLLLTALSGFFAIASSGGFFQSSGNSISHATMPVAIAGVVCGAVVG